MSDIKTKSAKEDARESSTSHKGLFPGIEEKVISYWGKNGTFNKSLTHGINKTGKTQYVFYDGPPFANGLPHYGHLLTGFAKDLFARYHTMLGEKTERRFGWDCHGLPAEMESEKQLGVSGRIAIKEYGIDKFNAHCQTSVLRYTQEWKDYVNRQARWVDFENNYKTMDKSYMESVIWAFKTLYDKGMLYEAHRVVPYSWKCQTPLSNFETHLDNSYRRKKSKSVYVKCTIEDPSEKIRQLAPSASKFFFVIWTTTPWTLPSNLALAVNKEVEYTAIERDGNAYIVAVDLLEKMTQIICPDEGNTKGDKKGA